MSQSDIQGYLVLMNDLRSSTDEFAISGAMNIVAPSAAALAAALFSYPRTSGARNSSLISRISFMPSI